MPAFLRITTVITVLACAIALPSRMRLDVPPRWNPWAPLRVDDAPNALTPFKLARLDDHRAECLAVLAQSPFQYRVLPDRATGAGCGFDNAVSISATHFRWSTAFSLSCPAAVALALWERHGVQRAARAELGQAVVGMEHFGSYACRNLYGRERGARSRHATADALDVAAFVLADGRRIRVAESWGAASANGRFLRDVHDAGCETFDAVLGPGYNAAHRDHFHLDIGPFRACR